MPDGVSTGAIVQGHERQEAITLLAQGFSITFIAQRLKRAKRTIEVIRDIEWSEILRRKPLLAAQAERNALLAGEQIAEALAAHKFPINSLPVVYGVSIDKVIALRDPMGGSQQHLHLHLQPNDVVGRFNSLLASLEEKAKLLPAAPAAPTSVTDLSAAPPESPQSAEADTDPATSDESPTLDAHTKRLEVS
jgi:hypothetical protein